MTIPRRQNIRGSLLMDLLSGAYVLLRVGVALRLGDAVPPARDDYPYSRLATQLLPRHRYRFRQAWHPFTPADTPTAHWSFLCAVFLAGVYAAFGVHRLAGRLVQAVLSGGCCDGWCIGWREWRRGGSGQRRRENGGGGQGEGKGEIGGGSASFGALIPFSGLVIRTFKRLAAQPFEPSTVNY